MLVIQKQIVKRIEPVCKKTVETLFLKTRLCFLTFLAEKVERMMASRVANAQPKKFKCSMQGKSHLTVAELTQHKKRDKNNVHFMKKHVCASGMYSPVASATAFENCSTNLFCLDKRFYLQKRLGTFFLINFITLIGVF